MAGHEPIDEARLRELIGDSVLSACREYSDVKAGKIKDLPFHTRCIVENATDAIWDALSAERERGDRAVGLLREAVPETLTYEGEPDDVERASWTSNGLKRRTEAFLATQKAEGAKT